MFITGLSGSVKESTSSTGVSEVMPTKSELPLLLKVDQSVDEMSPREEAEAVGMLRVWVVAPEEKPKPPLIEEVAKIWETPVRPFKDVSAVAR